MMMRRRMMSRLLLQLLPRSVNLLLPSLFVPRRGLFHFFNILPFGM
jgi:hypothetical protein